MKNRSESEINKVVLANTGLVHHILKKININPSDYDDFLQIGKIGLIKAAMTFDETRQIKFGTYAARCIENEIYMYLRKNKNDSRNISLNEPISEDKDGNALTLEDILSDESETNFIEISDYIETIEKAISLILNCFTERERYIFLYNIGGIVQTEIGNRFNISQSYISRVEKRLRIRIKKYIEKDGYIPDRPFGVTVRNNWIKICFFTEDIYRLGQALENFAYNVETIKFFNIKVEGNKIEMYFLSEQESFNLIAQILEEMEKVGVYIE